MLEKVMRRFGVSSSRRSHDASYFESVTDDLLARVDAQVLEATDAAPLVLVTRELLALETDRDEASNPRLDDEPDPEVLQGYLTILSDNDRAPLTGQLSTEELGQVRKMLLATPGNDRRAVEVHEELLGLLEDKFSSGQFSQAALLLRLFETTQARRRANERTLFYEEMLSRFGVPRLSRIGNGQIKRFQKGLASRDDPATRLMGAAGWLAQNAQVTLNVLDRQLAQRTAWETTLAPLGDAENRAEVVDLLTPPRWRPLAEDPTEPVLERLRLHIDESAHGLYLDRLLKACYFIVVVTTRTGFEPYINSYFQWVERTFGFPGARLLPTLHRMTTIDERGLEEAITTLRREHFTDKASEVLAGFGDETLTSAIDDLLEHLAGLDPNEIPPGEYDLGGLIMDKLTGFSCDEPTLMLRVHRIC